MAQTLSFGAAHVVEDVLKYGPKELGAQALSQWRGLQAALDEICQVVASYRAVLRHFLKGWSEPERSAMKSWNALSRMIVGSELIPLIETWAPDSKEAWAELRSGAAQMHAEWIAVEDNDPTSRNFLWGIGTREFPLEEWHKDHTSPLGSWLRVEAEIYTGEKYMMILPDDEITASGIRLGEPPSLYLKPWDWLDFVLPQLAYRRVSLRADLGSNMLVAIRPK